MPWRTLALACLAVLASACSRAPRLEPENANAATETIDLSGHRGQSFDAFVRSPGMERYALTRLDLSDDERARLSRDLVDAQPSRLVVGGGAQALVFVGCARAGCDAGQAVLAFGSQGETFVGVRDQGAGEEFLPDDRMEALLRLASASGRWWDDPGGAEAPPQTTAAP